jgi:hypothetical protein
MTRTRTIDEKSAAMRQAFLRALKHRVDTRPTGTVTLPTGAAAVAEIKKVLAAIEHARKSGGRS